ncbi:DALR-1 domain-containing protein [Mycena venus]|uniref:DALR-1 domain-containing protein n=1 Tax=Mycena venus TaxID=2733690 RepID=A0A8H6WXD2_9AGAR|nr:DALR-1 domain-containing protein [Mycena venus]
MPRRAAPKPAEFPEPDPNNLEHTSSEVEPSIKNLAQLRTNWKWAAFSQFFYTFSHLFQMEDVSLTDIEDDLSRETNIFLPRVMTRLLFILSYDRKVSLDNWQAALRKQHNRRDPASNPIGPEPHTETHESRYRYESVSVDDPTGPPADDATVGPREDTAEADEDLAASEKAVSALPSGSRANTEEKTSPAPDPEPQEEEGGEARFQNPTRLRTLMKSDDEDATWRIEPIGYDAKSNAYWLIGADRLWIQRAHPRPPRYTATTSSLKRKRPENAAKASAVKSKRPATKRARLASEDPKLTVPAGGGRAAKAQAKLKLDQQAKELAALNRAAGIKAPATRETRGGRTPVAPVRPLGTRVSARLRGADDDEWQAVPEDWLEKGGSRKKTPAKPKLKTGLESDDESVSDLTELSEESGDEDEAAENREQEGQPVEDFVEWETICVTLSDWEHIAERFERGSHYTEKALYKALAKEIVPVITEELREIERKRRLEEAIVHRKRSSRIANKEQEKEEARQLARQKAEVAEKKSRAQRLEARLAKEESERERREAAREQRRKAKEEQQAQSTAEDESTDMPVDVVGNEDPSSIHLNRVPEPSRRNGNAIASTSTSGTRTPVGDDWILNCEICHRSGLNLDDGMSMLCCDKPAGPRRNWDQVEFICRQCQTRRMAAKNPGQYPPHTVPGSYMSQAAPSSSSYTPYGHGLPVAAHPPRDYPGLYPAPVNGTTYAQSAVSLGPQQVPYPTSVNYRPQLQPAPPPPRISAGPSYNTPGPQQQQYQGAYDRSAAQYQHIAPNVNVNRHHAPIQYQRPAAANVQGWNMSSTGHNAPYPPPSNGVSHERHQYGDVPQWHAGGSQQAAAYGYHNGS